MSKWDGIEAPQGQGSFLKLENGENKIRLVSIFEPRGTHFIQGEKKSYPCIGKEQCFYCQQGLEPNVKYLVHVIDRKNGKFKLAELGYSVISQLKEFRTNSDYAFDEIPPYDITILKKGESLKTEYTVIPARTNVLLTAAETEEVSKLKSLEDFVEADKKKRGRFNSILQAQPEEQIPPYDPYGDLPPNFLK